MSWTCWELREILPTDDGNCPATVPLSELLTLCLMHNIKTTNREEKQKRLDDRIAIRMKMAANNHKKKRRRNDRPAGGGSFLSMPSAGIEPVTPSLRVKCSTDWANSAQNESGYPLLLWYNFLNLFSRTRSLWHWVDCSRNAHRNLLGIPEGCHP